jgi:hypothetical protein
VRFVDTWQRLSIDRIEDLSDAVYGAGLEATQMSTAPLSGSLIHADCDGFLLSSGRIDGQVALAGPLSRDRITLGVGLKFGPGSRHWLADVEDGATGVFLPGDEHYALYSPGSLYLTATMTPEQLETAAAEEELVLDRRGLGESRVDARASPIRPACAMLAIKIR